MNSRSLQQEGFPYDIVSLTLKILPLLDLTDLNRLLLFAEEEIIYRQEQGLLNETD